MSGILTKEIILKAFVLLDQKLVELRQQDHQWPSKVEFLVGGGGAMVLAHSFPLATADVDATPLGVELEQMDPVIKAVAQDMGLPGDWLNPYFARFAIYLPTDFKQRLVTVFTGQILIVRALGLEDMLILKCFAHRTKDIPHAKALIKKGANIGFVEKHIEALKRNKIPQAQAALDFLDDLLNRED